MKTKSKKIQQAKLPLSKKSSATTPNLPRHVHCPSYHCYHSHYHQPPTSPATPPWPPASPIHPAWTPPTWRQPSGPPKTNRPWLTPSQTRCVWGAGQGGVLRGTAWGVHQWCRSRCTARCGFGLLGRRTAEWRLAGSSGVSVGRGSVKSEINMKSARVWKCDMVTVWAFEQVCGWKD